jgi:hypothetical protein
MAVTPPNPYSMSDIKSKLMRPALTSHFECQFNLPPSVLKFYREKQKAFSVNNTQKNFIEIPELISLSCCDATLPGSTLYTHDVTDYTGVMEKIPYRRVYDDRADFTFYVDHDYEVIKFFEVWMQYIVDEQYTEKDAGGMKALSYSYRVNYPDGKGDNKDIDTGYRTSIFLKKFERDYGRIQGDIYTAKKSDCLTYNFIQAYPLSIMSMPVSYESSQLLKCTVSFSYIRYVITSENNVEIAPPNPKLTQAKKFGPAFGTDQQFFNGLAQQ